MLSFKSKVLTVTALAMLAGVIHAATEDESLEEAKNAEKTPDDENPYMQFTSPPWASSTNPGP